MAGRCGWHCAKPSQTGVTGLTAPDVELVATVLVYALWLPATRGRRRSLRIVRTRPNGTIERIELNEWYGVTGGADDLRRLLEAPAPDAADEQV